MGRKLAIVGLAATLAISGCQTGRGVTPADADSEAPAAEAREQTFCERNMALCVLGGGGIVVGIIVVVSSLAAIVALTQWGD